MPEITFVQALRDALYEEMRGDDKIFIMGEDVGLGEGAFGVTRGLMREFGSERVKDAPISEAAIVGAGVGAAMTGTRPVVEIMFGDFLSVAFDEVYNKAAKWRYGHGGQFRIPMVIRSAFGHRAGNSMEHSQCPEAVFMHSPGIKIVAPSTPYDAKGLLKSAIRDDNPVLFFEHKQLYRIKGEVPEEEYTLPIGVADVKRKGTDVTIVAWSLMVHKALEAADVLAGEGINAEVVDLRTIAPLDKEAVLNSVASTHRLVIVEEPNKTGGVGGEIAAIVAEEGFELLDAPIMRVASLDVPIPYSRVLEEYVLPSVERIIDAVKTICTY
jgi:pyruvate/2-oxoglutarate/acetoin dehydrogenase E1 component